MTVLRGFHDLQPLPSGRRRHAVWGFAVLCMGLGLGIHNTALDKMWIGWAHRQSWLPDQFWLFMTQWGDSAQALVVLLAVFVQHPTTLAVALKAWVMGAVTSPLLKLLWDSPRPLSVLDPELLMVIGKPPVMGHAMPSGHAMAAAAVCALLFMGLDSRRPLLRLWVVLLGATVALSRIAVGAHWPGDVLVGVGLGCALVLLAEVWELRQPWSAHLASRRVQWALLWLMALMLWTIWQLPSEGWGMTLARAVAIALAAWSGLRICLGPDDARR